MLQRAGELMQRLSLRYPIIQAPMAGGGDTPALVAAVCEAGALGCIGASYLSPDQIAATVRAVRERTARPFGINLFAPLPLAAADTPRNAATASPRPAPSVQAALDSVAPFYAELGLAPPAAAAVAGAVALPFEAQLAAALDSGAAAFSFTFGLLPAEAVQAIKQRGPYLMGMATTVEEALTLQRAGVDAVIAQGSEAGGHRGTFIGDFEDAMVGTLALVPQTVDAVEVPVVASGGIMDGRGIAAALALGAEAVQMGTAFLTCTEAGIPPAYQQAILAADEHATRLTSSFSGRPARGIVNRFMVELDRPEARGARLPFPQQNALTRPLRTAAARAGRSEFLSLWAGQGTRLARRQSARELIERLVRETEVVIRRLRG